MIFQIYNQQQILSSKELTNSLLDTIIENLSYIYGPDMGSDDDRRGWIHYNLEIPNPSWHAVIGKGRDNVLGFVIFSLQNRTLVIHDLELPKVNRHYPALLMGLLKTMLCSEADKFDQISGYINKANHLSQRNFLKHATSITETERGYTFLIGPEKTSEIKGKFQKST